MPEEYYRHGDLLLSRIDRIPDLAKIINSMVLQEGEVTGHKHILKGKAQILELEDQKYVQVEEATELLHPDHKTLVLERGAYLLQHERELDILGEIRNVSD